MPTPARLPAHTLPADQRSRRIRPYTRAEWRLRLHRVPVGLLRNKHLATHRITRRAAPALAAS